MQILNYFTLSHFPSSTLYQKSFPTQCLKITQKVSTLYERSEFNFLSKYFLKIISIYKNCNYVHFINETFLVVFKHCDHPLITFCLKSLQLLLSFSINFRKLSNLWWWRRWVFGNFESNRFEMASIILQLLQQIHLF